MEKIIKENEKFELIGEVVEEATAYYVTLKTKDNNVVKADIFSINPSMDIPFGSTLIVEGVKVLVYGKETLIAKKIEIAK